ncbi:hypothetical protein ABT084_08815 [Streptomyces sp. NPDC002138]|uniref:hypothetical protein n=1 Tax=Streptomyces sp. NPDC002138 TaxID=3154410 RepID=UPI00331B27BF
MRKINIKSKGTGRRAAMTAAVLALSAGGVGISTGSAAAYSGWYQLSSHPTGHGVGVYNSQWGTAKVGYYDLVSASWSGDRIHPVCWIRGANIDSAGNVWYRLDAAQATNANPYYGTTYVYGAYADGNWLFHNNQLPEC